MSSLGLSHAHALASCSPSPKHTLILTVCCLVAQVAPDRALQLGRALSQHLGQVLQVVTGGDTEFPHKVLGGALQVAIVLAVVLLLGSAEVGVGRDGRGALEALQAGLGLGLRVGVVLALAEELIGGDSLLVPELASRIVLAVICVRVSGLPSGCGSEQKTYRSRRKP